MALAERLSSTVSWRGEDAQLLHEAREVRFEPLFHNLAVHNPVDVRAGSGRFVPRRRDPLKRTGVLDPVGIVDDHHFALRDAELGRDMDVEGRQVGGEELFECLAASDWPRDDTTVMADKVRGMQLI